MHTSLISIPQLATDVMLALSPALYLAIGAVLLFLVITIPLFLLLKEKEFSGARSLVPYTILALLTVVYYRVPFLAMSELNPDESQEIAAALTLLHDPVYWRSVDLHTHGPLATYPLLLPELFGIQIDYGSARLIGLAMLLSSALLIFSMFRKSAVNTLAVIALLPLITFMCMTDYWDFVGYNAEHPVIFMVVLALFFTDKALLTENRLSINYLYLAGVTVGSAPFVKIQCLPMLFAIAAITYTIIWFRCEAMMVRIRLAGIYSMGCLTFSSLLFVYLRYFDLLDDFVVRFFSGQLNYVKEKSSVQKLGQFFETFDWVNLSAWYYFDLLIAADIFFAGLLINFMARRHFSTRRDNAGAGTFFSANMVRLSLFSMVTAMSLVAIYVPGRHFRHYFMLLAFPLGILTGKLFILTYRAVDRSEKRNLCAVLFVFATVCGQCYYKYVLSSYNVLLLKNKLTYDLVIHNSNIFTNPAKEARDREVTDAIKMYTTPGEKMVIWGWANKYYISAKQIIGCRTAAIHLVAFNMYENKSYYFKSFMHELEAAKAPVFLDAVEPRQFGFSDKSRYAFEQFPELNKYVQANYTCMKDIQGFRIFVSKSRLREIQKQHTLL